MSREGAARRPLSFKGYARSADRERMASQLRLHVLLPLAFLAVIGAAFGVYTMGKAPGGGGGGSGGTSTFGSLALAMSDARSASSGDAVQ